MCTVDPMTGETQECGLPDVRWPDDEEVEVSMTSSRSDGGRPNQNTEMLIHMPNNVAGGVVCGDTAVETNSSMNIDLVNCVACLRALVKDAVIYGNSHRARRT